jgi:hypothetical protein
VELPPRARIIVQPAIQLPAHCRGWEWDISGSQPIHRLPLPRSGTPVEPTFADQYWSRRYRPRDDSGSRHIELESGEHELNAFQAIRRMDEVLIANFMIFQDAIDEGGYDIVTTITGLGPFSADEIAALVANAFIGDDHAQLWNAPAHNGIALQDAQNEVPSHSGAAHGDTMATRSSD